MKPLLATYHLPLINIKKNALRAIAILTLFFFSACTMKESGVPYQSLSFPDKDFSKIRWLNDDLVAFSFDPLQAYEQGSSIPKDLVLPSDPTCSFSTQYTIQGTFPDGRLQIWKHCFTEPRSKTYLMAYDWDTGKLDEVAGPLPVGSTEAYINPEQTKGVVFLDSKFARKTLYSIWEGGFGPLDVNVTDDGKSWNLSNFYPDFSDSQDLTTGDAGRADWSPDGNSIAFFASSEAIGKSGSERFYVEYKLYVMSAETLDPTPVLDQVHFPFIIKWSPNSKYISFIGQYGKSEQDGIWLYSVEKNSIVNIDNGKFQDILWNPTKNSLFAIKCDKDSYCSQILEYDLAEIIKP